MPRKRKKRRPRNWIKPSIKRPGALHRRFGIPRGRKIPRKLLLKFRHAAGTLGYEVREALTLRKLSRRRRRRK